MLTPVGRESCRGFSLGWGDAIPWFLPQVRSGGGFRWSTGEWRVRSAPMHDPLPEHDDFIHSEEFLHRLMRRQFRLSAACAACFVVVLLGMPLLNYFAPGLMAMRVGGFTLSWLVLGVLFFPFVWVISGVFIRKSLRMESEEAEGALAENRKRASRQS